MKLQRDARGTDCIINNWSSIYIRLKKICFDVAVVNCDEKSAITEPECCKQTQTIMRLPTFKQYQTDYLTKNSDSGVFMLFMLPMIWRLESVRRFAGSVAAHLFVSSGR